MRYKISGYYDTNGAYWMPPTCDNCHEVLCEGDDNNDCGCEDD